MAALQGGVNYVCGRNVEPLSATEKERLATIFSAWRHPAVREHRERAATLGDGSPEAALKTLAAFEAFLLAEVGSGNDQLYESTVHALHRLLVSPAPEPLELVSAGKELLLQVEPFAFKLLALLAPEKWEKFGKKKGLETALVQLSKIDANPYTKMNLPNDEFINRTGGEDWTSFEHAVRDVIGGRLDVAHRSTEMDPHIWRSAMCVILALLEHNAPNLPDALDTPPGSIVGKKRFMDEMKRLNKAAGIAIHREEARPMRDELSYFQAIQSNLRKYTVGGSGKTEGDLNAAIRQIVSEAVASEGVVDIFGAVGLKKPDISVLSDEFLENVRDSPHKNLQLEVLKKLISDEVKSVSRANVVQSRKFSEMLERTLLAYQNRTLETAQVILELIDLAKQMRDAPGRGEKLGLSDDEMAFYDALVDHGNVKEMMSDKQLADIAHDLVKAIRASVSIDWTQKQAVRADMRRKVKRLLRKHGYPPDKRAEALITVIEQAEVVCRDWSAAA